MSREGPDAGALEVLRMLGLALFLVVAGLGVALVAALAWAVATVWHALRRIVT